MYAKIWMSFSDNFESKSLEYAFIQSFIWCFNKWPAWPGLQSKYLFWKVGRLQTLLDFESETHRQLRVIPQINSFCKFRLNQRQPLLEKRWIAL